MQAIAREIWQQNEGYSASLQVQSNAKEWTANCTQDNNVGSEKYVEGGNNAHRGGTDGMLWEDWAQTRWWEEMGRYYMDFPCAVGTTHWMIILMPL